MYNDEKNLYNYTYRKDGSEQHSYQAPNSNGYQPPVQDMKPVKKNRMGIKITALALSCALLGGVVGGGIVYGFHGGSKEDATVNVSNRTVSKVSLNTVDGKKQMTDSEVYAANVNSVVSINTTGSSGTNVFGQTVQTASAGSGFILTTDGYIVTNHHVIDGANTVKVTLYNGDTYDATIVGSDEDYDIAVLKIDASDLQPVTLGDSSQLNVGDRVLAIGNPLGELTFSMSGGMVSSVNRAINVQGTPFNMIQTDTSINPGNSGGPLVNSYGEVVGIVSAKYSNYSNESVEGLGFAIPINDVIAMIKDIMTNGYVTNKPYLGITGMSMTNQIAAQFQYDRTTGVFVSNVQDNSAAAKAGLQMGDVIIKVGDTDISTMEDLTAVKKQYTAGDTTTFTIDRKGQTLTMDVTWDSVPADQQQSTTTQDNSQSTQNSSGYTDPYDLFNYFFGNRGYSGSSYSTTTNQNT